MSDTSWVRVYNNRGIYTAGTVLAGAFTTTSDRRLKNITGEFTDGLNKVRLLKPYNFTFKDKKRMPGRRVGVMAQDLQKIFPDAVAKDANSGYLSIRENDMFYAMVNSIQQLDRSVQWLAKTLIFTINRINIADTKIKNLENQNKQLKIKIAQVDAKNIQLVAKDKQLETQSKQKDIKMKQLETRVNNIEKKLCKK